MCRQCHLWTHRTPGQSLTARVSVPLAHRPARQSRPRLGILLAGKPELFGIYANFHVLPSDHVMLFTVRHWKQSKVPPPSREIAEQRFFAKDALPTGINESTQARIREVLDGEPRGLRW